MNSKPDSTATRPAGPRFQPAFNSKAFGGRILEARKRKNMTQSDLGDLLGVTKTTVSNWETNGHGMALDLLAGLCLALDLTPTELLFAEDESPIEVREGDVADYRNSLKSPGGFDSKAFGQRLQDARRRRKKSQSDVADHLQVTTMAISFWERGERAMSLDMLVRACSYLDVRPAEIIGVGNEFTAEDISVLGEPGAVRLVARLASLADRGFLSPKRMGILMALFDDFEDRGITETLQRP